MFFFEAKREEMRRRKKKRKRKKPDFQKKKKSKKLFPKTHRVLTNRDLNATLSPSSEKPNLQT